ncbi:MAG: ABC transporter permease [Bacilli bacterium]|jgi:multidrug/hemolysin transport system permease protein|nr:ABC transporter permease [Bacilli bacterium]MCH4202088.1 ABC transporter permease [Bacilli bacterium]MCH4235550.1 ABC transporter permease [Bacilli bacterium]
MGTIWQLTKRNLLIFFRDRISVFFSFLTPLIVLLLYILFLGEVQIRSLEDSLLSIPGMTSGMIKSFVDAWFLSSVLAVGAISGSVSGAQIIVQDQAKRVYDDFLVTPTKASSISISYFLSAVITSILIELVVFLFTGLYLLIRGSLIFDFLVFGKILLLIIIGSISAVLFVLPAGKLFRSESSFGGFIGLSSALSGFLLGAYMPPTMFPVFIQNIIALVPGAHVAALLRQVTMSGPLNNMTTYIGLEATQSLADGFSFHLNFFSNELGNIFSYLYIGGFIIICTIVNVIAFRKNSRGRNS